MADIRLPDMCEEDERVRLSEFDTWCKNDAGVYERVKRCDRDGCDEEAVAYTTERVGMAPNTTDGSAILLGDYDLVPLIRRTFYCVVCRPTCDCDVERTTAGYCADGYGLNWRDG